MSRKWCDIMNENIPNVVKPSLNLDNIPDEIKFSPERYNRIIRYKKD